MPCQRFLEYGNRILDGDLTGEPDRSVSNATRSLTPMGLGVWLLAPSRVLGTHLLYTGCSETNKFSDLVNVLFLICTVKSDTSNSDTIENLCFCDDPYEHLRVPEFLSGSLRV